jgi:hypothetical protein
VGRCVCVRHGSTLYQSSSSMMFLRGLLMVLATVVPPVLICSSHLMSWSSLTWKTMPSRSLAAP